MGQAISSACGCCCRKPERTKEAQYQPLNSELDPSAIQDVAPLIQNSPFYKKEFEAKLGSLTSYAPEDFYEDNLLSLLTLLAHSSDIQFNRAAAAIFAEITEKTPKEVDKIFLQPLCLLLNLPDEEVQRTSSAALGNLAILGENKAVIVEMNVVPRLLQLTASNSTEVQCNAAGCITNLVTDDAIKSRVINPPLLERLLTLTQVPDVRVSRNAIGALLNLTHSASHRAMLLEAQAPYVLCHLLLHPDPDVIHYATTAISNMAVDETVRDMFADLSEFPSLLPTLIQLLNPPTPLRLQTQATLALRNLASSSSFQQYTIHSPALSMLVSHTKSEYPPLLVAAAACLRNLSICEDLTYRLQNLGLLDTFLDHLVHLVKYDGRVQSSLVQQLLATDGTMVTQEEIDEVQLHVISTIRNLAASMMENKRLLMQRHLISVFMSLVTKHEEVAPSVLCEIGAVIAVLASDHLCRRDMLQEHVLRLVQKLCEHHHSLEVIANGIAALANLAMRPTSLSLFIELLQVPMNANHALGILITQPDNTFKHLGLHCLDQLLQIRDPLIHQLLVPHLQCLHDPSYDLFSPHSSHSDATGSFSTPSSNLPTAIDASSIPSKSQRSDSDTSLTSQLLEIKRLTEKIKTQFEI